LNERCNQAIVRLRRLNYASSFAGGIPQRTSGALIWLTGDGRLGCNASGGRNRWSTICGDVPAGRPSILGDCAFRRSRIRGGIGGLPVCHRSIRCRVFSAVGSDLAGLRHLEEPWPDVGKRLHVSTTRALPRTSQGQAS
jgi:hypothetical protein